MDEQKINEIKHQLLALRERIVGEVTALQKGSLSQSLKDQSGNLSGYSIHLADLATDSYDREFTLSLASREQRALNDVDAALAKIDSGEYGSCEQCGHPIGEARLLAVPHARLCLQCKERQEKNKA
jgi:DnaK suppressor protein